MNKLAEWEKRENEKRLRELKKAGIELVIENIPRIIEFMSFRERSKREKDCPCYEERKQCHPEVKDLNCFLCACPNYDSDEIEGGCLAGSKKGKYFEHPNLPAGKVWDCSNCGVYHTPKSVAKYLEKNIGKLKELAEKLA
jgi:Zn-finger protein